MAKARKVEANSERVRRRAAFLKQVRPDRDRLGRLLRWVIEEKGTTQVAVATEIGMRPNMLSEIVLGRRKAELTELNAISKALNMELKTLVERWQTWV